MQNKESYELAASTIAQAQAPSTLMLGTTYLEAY